MNTRSRLLPLVHCFLTIASLSLAPSVVAEGGVVFESIAQDFEYRRAPAANFPELVALLESSLEGEGLEFLSIPESLPGRVRGIPGVAVFDYDGDDDLDLYVTQGPGRSAPGSSIWSVNRAVAMRKN